MTRNDSDACSGTVDVGYCIIRVPADGPRGALILGCVLNAEAMSLVCLAVNETAL
jgi:hypothetical protein